MRISDHEANRLRVLKAIRRAEPVSRTELVELAGMPGWAISELVAELLERGLLVEEKAPTAGRGRPRVQLRLNPDGARVIGAVLFNEDAGLTVEIANLRGESLFRRASPLAHGASLAVLADLIAAEVDETITTSGVAREAIHSLGLGVPGLVDSSAGTLHWLPAYGPGPLPLAEAVGRRLRLPVFLESTGSLLTRAEHWFGPDRQVDDFTMISVGLGIAFGQYADGLLRTGGHGGSPEFGHTKVTLDDGAPCYCGARGCLWSYASVSGIVGRISERRAEHVPLGVQSLVQAFRRYAGEARAGEPVARDVFGLAGRALGAAVASYINLCDPARILVIAKEPAWSELVEAPFQAALVASTLPPLRGRAPLSFKVHEDVALSQGAAALVLEQLYSGAAPGPGVSRRSSLSPR